jgi:hypothetical protein
MFTTTDSPLLRLYRTEYSADYEIMRKNGVPLTDNDVRKILGYPMQERKKFLGIF